MTIKQFEYKPLSHYSYALVSNGEMVVIDPERDPKQYYAFAEEHDAKIIAVIETHPHADFISSHRQIHKETGATIYCSEKVGADYQHRGFDDGDSLTVGDVTLKAINTPGHSPDSITVVALKDEETVLFTGDTLFIGDVGRPDLRENVGNMTAKRVELAEAMFETMQTKFNDLPDNAIVYPAHGAGSLCGKNLSSANSSTLGNERMGNWAFKNQTKEEFVATILDSQPFIPHYFGYDVDMNKKGARTLSRSTAEVQFLMQIAAPENNIIIDVRDEADFKAGHLEGSINIMAVSDTAKFETWLGSIVNPNEDFYIVVKKASDARKILNRTAKIGYERLVKGVITLPKEGLQKNEEFNLQDFKANPDKYTIVDIRNASETETGKFFKDAITIPLHELRERANEIPTSKPIVVHCAGGYRSASGSSILDRKLKDATVYDLSDAVKQFQ